MRSPAPERRDLAAHLGAVIFAGGFLLWINRNQWFLADEWNMIVDRRLVGGDGFEGVWDAHNSHLAATVVIVYRLLFTLFGVRTYFPYLVVLGLTLLLLMHLGWRVLLRLGIDPMLATFGALLLVLYGEGFEITTGAIGIQNAGALALGFAAFLAMPATSQIAQRDAFVLLLLALALATSSGVAIPIVVVLGVVALTQRGWRPALLLTAIPALLFSIWYVFHGEPATAAQGRLGTVEALRGMPTFVAHGIWWTFEDLFDLDGGGPIVLLASAVIVAFALRWRESTWQVALAFALGAPVYLGLTTFGRGGFGVSVAGDSRYAFVTFVFMVPVLVLAVDRLVRRLDYGTVVASLLLGALVVLQAVVVARHARASGRIEQETKRRIVAAAEVVQGDATVLAVPVPEYEPNLDAAKLKWLAAEGKLPGNVHPSRRDRLTARLYLLVSTRAPLPIDERRIGGAVLVGGVSTVPTNEPDCVRTGPIGLGETIDLRFPAGGAIVVEAEPPTVLRLRFAHAGATSRVRRVFFPGERLLISDTSTRDVLEIGVETPRTLLRICGVTA